MGGTQQGLRVAPRAEPFKPGGKRRAFSHIITSLCLIFSEWFEKYFPKVVVFDPPVYLKRKTTNDFAIVLLTSVISFFNNQFFHKT